MAGLDPAIHAMGEAMAHTGVQIEVEDWVRENWMSDQFQQRFYRNRIKLESGGVFDFDAVSEDKSIAACISTSGGKTSRGKLAVGKLHKLRSDMLFLHMAVGVTQKLMILTELDMLELCEKEKTNGRTPSDIAFRHAPIPEDLQARLIKAREIASKEMTGEKVIDVIADELLVGNEKP
ncbi:hypothetical protein [Ferrovibrio sp.]|uniref:hypothetical protein n=1 Tax=Ferrovibrio sp. TaxID=1917215 RepID=UPI000CBDF46D|nr:hypothetical protein [Ferrovibrio sp.]PJI37618.1 MAG: hypothetical protein CTR53_19225 [Ferrovibrio sp.]